MERKKIIYLFLFAIFILAFSSCHSRHISDIKLDMTKKEVISMWGGTNLITYKTTNGTTLETWEYHFTGSGTVCQITFIQDRVAANPQCRRAPVEERYYARSEVQPYPDPYYYYPYPYSYYYRDLYPFPYYYPYPFYFGGYYGYYRPYYYRPYYHSYHYPYYRYRR